MFFVTFRGEKNKTQQYKTEAGALLATWKWLKANNNKLIYCASILGPGVSPRVITDWNTLPFAEKQQVDFLTTGKWKILKQQVFQKYGNTCACCGKSPSNGVILHVDHIKPRSHYPELEDDINNLQILCADCNVGKSNKSEMKWR